MASSSPGKCHFVDQAPEDINCIICTSILREPVQIECCGQLFCEECLSKWLKEYRKCPYCRNTDLKYIKDRRMKRFINSFKIYCPNRSNGCQETTTGINCNDHLEKCLFVKVACVNTCGITILRKNVPRHMTNECPKRQVHCQYCNEEGMHKDIVSEHHTNTCPLLPIDCPNNCKFGKIQRRDMPDHLKECPLEPVKCPFAHTGCKEVILRKEVETHKMFNADTHLELALTTVSETNTKLKDMTHFARDLQDQIDELTEDSTAAQNKLERTILEVQKKSQATQNELIATKGELKTTKNQFKAAQNEFKATQRSLEELSSKFDRLVSALTRQETTDPTTTQATAATNHTREPALTMLELGQEYELPLPQKDNFLRISPSFYLPPGYRVSITVSTQNTCTVYLEKGIHDTRLKWPMSKMVISLRNNDNQFLCTIIICEMCGITVNRVVGNQTKAIIRTMSKCIFLPTPGKPMLITVNKHICLFT